jgi:integrase
MPRLIYRLPKYSLHKPSGQAKVRHNGRTVYLGKFGSPDSHEAYARFIASIPKPEDVAPFVAPIREAANPEKTLLVGEVVLRFFEHATGYYVRNGVPTGEHITIRACLRPLTKRFGQLPADEFGPKKLKLVRTDMIELGWTRRTINKAVNIVKRCFTWAASEELVPGETALALKTVQGLQKDRTPAREKDPVGPVADEEVDAVLPIVSDLVANVIRTMRLTGARPGEVLAMTAEEIDRSDPSCWVYRPADHKCTHKNKDRAVMIGARAQEVILPRILKTEPGGKLFPITRAALRRAINRGCMRALPHPVISQIEPSLRTPEQPSLRTPEQKSELKTWIKAHSWHPNQVRHTVATEIRAKFGLEAAQVLLGHTRADVTQTYAEHDQRRAADIARKIG